MQPQPTQPEQREIAHLIVTVDAYNRVLNTLGQLPYVQAQPVIDYLKRGTVPVYADDPMPAPLTPPPPSQGSPGGRIVDNPDDEGSEGLESKPVDPEGSGGAE